MINEVIVVEGEHDKSRILKLYPDALVVITNGSEVSEATLKMLEELNKTHRLVLLLDPDSPGERIRALIHTRCNDCVDAFIPKKYAICEQKHKVGVEHAPDEIIKNVLDKALSTFTSSSNLTINECFELGLSGEKNSSEKRLYIANKLNLGNPNFKTLYKRLVFLGIEKKDLERILNEKNWNN